MVPSGRLNVESADAVTPGPAVGVPVAVAAGQADAHCPVQVLVPAVVSLSKRYNVNPLESVSTLPRVVVPTLTVAFADGAAVDVVVTAGARVVVVATVVDGGAELLLLLPHAARPNAATASVANRRM